MGTKAINVNDKIARTASNKAGNECEHCVYCDGTTFSNYFKITVRDVAYSCGTDCDLVNLTYIVGPCFNSDTYKLWTQYHGGNDAELTYHKSNEAFKIRVLRNYVLCFSAYLGWVGIDAGNPCCVLEDIPNEACAYGECDILPCDSLGNECDCPCPW